MLSLSSIRTHSTFVILDLLTPRFCIRIRFRNHQPVLISRQASSKLKSDAPSPKAFSVIRSLISFHNEIRFAISVGQAARSMGFMSVIIGEVEVVIGWLKVLVDKMVNGGCWVDGSGREVVEEAAVGGHSTVEIQSGSLALKRLQLPIMESNHGKA
ncbi:hypothetical protein L484_019045 [Morus notabilis]|uniref:Uncharacterized protein n=1 Tax=Morus notabilis TaxID=981085 RepID=W9R273_9ROSA|nr:hypothetical protein L484_019045 [Morus notabilis]